MSTAAIAWIALAGLVVLAGLVLLVREIPSIRRELKLMAM